VIKTPRLTLVKVQPDDFDDFFRLQTEPRAREFLGGPADLSKIKNKFEEILAPKGTAKYWAVKRAGGKLLGLVSITDHHDQQDLELSYQFLPEFWGQGFAFEALSAVLTHAREDLKHVFLIAETQQKNLRSTRLLEKLGMRPIRVIQRFGLLCRAVLTKQHRTSIA
jgi:ribosomal-protein-alanine N-acetyltransferase